MQPLTGEPTSESVVVNGGDKPLPSKASDTTPSDPAKYILSFKAIVIANHSECFPSNVVCSKKECSLASSKLASIIFI